jgi:hypothetical protein
MADIMETLAKVGAAGVIGYLVGNYGKDIKDRITSALPKEIQPYSGIITGVLIGGLIKYFGEDFLGDYTDVVAAAAAAGFAADPPEVMAPRAQARAISPEAYVFGGVIR